MVGIVQISALILILIFVSKRLSVAALLWFDWNACVAVTSWFTFDWLIFLFDNICSCGIAGGKSSWWTLDNYTTVMQCCVVVSAACLAAFCWLAVLLFAFIAQTVWAKIVLVYNIKLLAWAAFLVIGTGDSIWFPRYFLQERFGWLALFRDGNGGALGGFTVPRLLIVVNWFRLAGCAGKPELWVLNFLAWLLLLFKFPELLKSLLRRLFYWMFSRSILSYTCAWTSNHFCISEIQLE